jgi:hypothetical protein
MGLKSHAHEAVAITNLGVGSEAVTAETSSAAAAAAEAAVDAIFLGAFFRCCCEGGVGLVNTNSRTHQNRTSK